MENNNFNNQEEEIDLGIYIRILLRNKLVILLPSLIITTVAVINTFFQNKGFGCHDFLKCSSDIFFKDFDFLVMLGWTINDL